jgi:hypothetical protein
MRILKRHLSDVVYRQMMRDRRGTAAAAAAARGSGYPQPS